MSGEGRMAAKKTWTVDELAEVAGVTREIMLRRVATVLESRPWYQRWWFYLCARKHLRLLDE
jgi:hypothetical protein